MTNTQVKAMREMWEDATVVRGEKYTARQFALMPHSLRTSDYATTPDNKHFVWDNRNQTWTRWK